MLSCRVVKSLPSPARTAVILHGILANGSVWEPVARSLAALHPQWQFLLMDIRGHGESPGLSAPHCVASCSHDVLETLRERKVEPDLVVGHSFGGKVALGMIVEELPFFREKKIETWVLDISSLPPSGEAGLPRRRFVRVPDYRLLRAGHSLPLHLSHPDYSHVHRLIQSLRQLPREFTQSEFIQFLHERGVHPQMVGWLQCNIVPAWRGSVECFRVSYDIDVLEKLFISYQAVDYQSFLEEALDPKVALHFVRATKNPLWRPKVVQWFNRIARTRNVHLHTLHSNHSIHADNPDGLVELLGFALE